MRKLCLLSFFFIAVGCFCDTITGIVITTDKKVVTGAQISIFNLQNPHSPVKKTVSDKNGKFRFENLETGYYRLVASKNSFCDGILGRIEVNQPKFGIVNYEIILTKPGSISGFVYDPEGNPIPGAHLVVDNKRAKTDSKGYYRIDGINPGSRYVYADAAGFVRESRDSVIVKEGKETSGINFNLSYAGTVKGIVVDLETGKPLADVNIGCSGPVYISGKTDGSGRFLISGLKAGSYRVYFNKQGYQYSEANFEAIIKETADIGTIRLKLRDKYFYAVDREWIFTPDEKIKIYFNAFRIPSVLIEIYELDLFNEINNAKGKKISIRDILNTADISGKEPVLSKKFDISYPNPLSELYDRKITIGNLPEGVYVCKIKPEGISEHRMWFIVSDIGFISKSCGDTTIFTVFSISKGNVLKDVPVYVFDDAWQQRENLRTDGSGRFSSGDSPRFVIAYGKSFAFSDKSYSDGGYHSYRSIYAFTDRPVYRPNQTVYFKAITRIDDGNTYRIPDISNVFVKIFAPDGTAVYETSIKPAVKGSVSGEWTIPDEPQLGVYAIEFSTQGKDEIKGECSFKILEYRKPEFYIELVSDKSLYLPGEKIRAAVSAKYYFGAPVKNADVMWAVYSKQVWDYEDSEDDGYEYDSWWRGAVINSGSLKTDENGCALIEIPTKPSYQQKETYTIEVKMTDLSRREITASKQVVVLPGCFEILVSTDKYVYSPEDEISVNVATRYYLNYKAPLKHNMTVYISQETYDAKKRRWSFKEILEKKISFEGEKTTIKIKPSTIGYIKISVMSTDQYHNIITGTKYVWIAGKDYYSYWYGKKEIEIVTDKKEYNIGDTARILINSAYKDLDFLFTIEGNRLFENRLIRMNGNSVLLEIPVKEEYIPNFYVSICGVRNKNFISSIKPVKIGCKEKFLNVELLPAKKEFQPGESADYKIRITDFHGKPVSAEFSMAVVDESIYSISGELVPKIEDFFYGNKENKVSTAYSFYRWYYGGAGKDFAETDIRKKFKDTAFWLPYGFTDENGIAEIKFDLPDNLTTWRTTVKAVDLETKVGTGIDRLITTKPLIANLIAPRFLVEDDRLLISGIIHNHTGKTQRVYTNLSATGLDILDETEKTIEIESEKSTRIDWKVKVNSAKNATITLFARAYPYKDGMELTLPVFSYGSDERYVFANQCEDTKIDTFYLPAGTISASVDIKSYIYPSLVSGLFTSLEELANYPYGCVEQTLNGFLPAVQVADTLARLKKEDLYLLAQNRKEFEKMIEKLPKKVSEGIVKLYNFQNQDGGWGWWSNDRSNPYTTGYVMFGLTHIKKAGYLVDEDRFNKGLMCLKNMIASVDDYNQKTFILYVLTYAGEKNLQFIEDIYKNKDKLNAYTMAQLCLVLKESGDSRAKDLLDELCSKLQKPTSFLYYWNCEDGNYSWVNHNIEATAWGLRAILAIDPKRKEIPGILRYLVMRKRGGMWMSTKDTAICLFALTDYLKIADELSPDYTVVLSLNNTKIAEEKIDRESIKKFVTSLDIEPGENLKKGEVNSIEIRKNGKGNLYYSHLIKFSVRDVYIPPFDSGFKVTRRYTEIKPRQVVDSQGNNPTYVYDEINRVIKSGERIRVEIKISGSTRYEYIMIEDPIPAGFEVVDEPWDGSWWYCRKEVRDEKVAFFTTIWEEKEKTIVYYLRAETPGFYHILPAKVQLMYLPEIWGRSSGNTIVVE